MKRYISLALVAVVLVVSLAVPSYAAESEHYIEVLDFSTANGGSNFTSFGSGSTRFTFDLPSTYVPYGYNILFSAGHAPDQAYIDAPNGRVPLTIYSLGNHMYRAVCYDFIDVVGWVNLVFEDDTGDWVNFLSVKFFTSPTTSMYAPASGMISYGDGEESYFYFNSDDDYSGITLPGNSSWVNDSYRAYITIDDVYKFDSLDIQLYVSNLSISSISVSIGNTNIPFTHSIINYDYALTGSLINLTIEDFTLVENTDTLQISVLGNVASIDSAVCYIGILYSSGFVYAAEPNSVLHFFNQLIDFFTDQYQSLSGWIQNVSGTITTSFSTWFTDLSSWLSALGSSINSNISSWFSQLDLWIDTSSYEIRQTVANWFYDLSTWIEAQTNSINSSLDSWGQAIVDAINGDASDADKFKEQVDESNKELNDMAAVMDSFTTPDINSVNVDVGSYISPTDLSSLTAPMGMLFESNIVTTCIMISIIMGTVMFVLYGKR